MHPPVSLLWMFCFSEDQCKYEFAPTPYTIIVQVYYEFAVFLFLAQMDNSNKLMHNIMLESKRIHTRVLTDFFSSTKSRPTDLVYSEIIDPSNSILINLPENIRTFINKSTAHLTWERGKLNITDTEFISVISEIVSSIREFNKQVDEGRIKKQYEHLLEDDTFREIKNVVNEKLLSFCLINMDTRTQQPIWETEQYAPTLHPPLISNEKRLIV